MNSAAPYTELLGQDVYNNGRGRARPLGVPRNTLVGSGFASLDLRVSRDLKFGAGKDGRAMMLALDGFNVLNRVNAGPTSARSDRRSSASRSAPDRPGSFRSRHGSGSNKLLTNPLRRRHVVVTRPSIPTAIVRASPRPFTRGAIRKVWGDGYSIQRQGTSDRVEAHGCVFDRGDASRGCSACDES